MTDRLYNDLYPKLNSLKQIKINYNYFYNSWWKEKCLQYSGDKLSNYYDIFFSRFVTYNSLYNVIVHSKEQFGLLKKKRNKKHEIIERGEKEKATVEMVKQFDLNDNEAFATMDPISKNITEIISIIDSSKFAIIYKGGEPAFEKDKLLSQKLKGTNKNDKLSAILEILFNVRCNLFHGSKSYELNQISLLKPLNEILFSIVEILHASFDKMINGLISETEQEISHIEKKNSCKKCSLLHK